MSSIEKTAHKINRGCHMKRKESVKHKTYTVGSYNVWTKTEQSLAKWKTIVKIYSSHTAVHL